MEPMGTCETPLRAVEEAQGAKFGEWFGCQLPSEFSGFEAEYRALRESIGVVDENYRAWFSFTGPDRGRYLNAILTNNIRDLGPGQAVPALFLNAQGHIIAEMEILALPDRFLAASYSMIREALAAALDRYIIMDDVTMTDETEQFGVVSIEGPAAPAAVQEICGLALDSLPEFVHVEALVAGIPCHVQRRSPGGIPGAEFLSSRAAIATVWNGLCETASRHGGRPAGYSALSAVRLEAGIPWYGYEFDESVLPHEAGLENTHISFSKGCYVGQEIVERVRSRGHLNRHLALVQFSGEKTPARGTQLLESGKTAGHVTRAAWSPSHRAPIGFALLRREFLQPGSVLQLDHSTAAVLPFPRR